MGGRSHLPGQVGEQAPLGDGQDVVGAGVGDQPADPLPREDQGQLGPLPFRQVGWVPIRTRGQRPGTSDADAADLDADPGQPQGISNDDGHGVEHVLGVGRVGQPLPEAVDGPGRVVPVAVDQTVDPPLQQLAQGKGDEQRDDGPHRPGRRGGHRPDCGGHQHVDDDDTRAEDGVDRHPAENDADVEQAVTTDAHPAGDRDGEHAGRLERRGRDAVPVS